MNNVFMSDIIKAPPHVAKSGKYIYKKNNVHTCIDKYKQTFFYS